MDDKALEQQLAGIHGKLETISRTLDQAEKRAPRDHFWPVFVGCFFAVGVYEFLSRLVFPS